MRHCEKRAIGYYEVSRVEAESIMSSQWMHWRSVCESETFRFISISDIIYNRLLHWYHIPFLNLRSHCALHIASHWNSDRFLQNEISHKMGSISSVAETVSEIVECFDRFVFVNGHRVIECALSIFEGAAECKRFVVLVQMNRIRRVIAIWYFVHWNDIEKDEQEIGGDSVKAVNQAVGVGNNDSVKAKEVKKTEGMHFIVLFQCGFMRLLSLWDCVPMTCPMALHQFYNLILVPFLCEHCLFVVVSHYLHCRSVQRAIIRYHDFCVLMPAMCWWHDFNLQWHSLNIWVSENQKMCTFRSMNRSHFHRHRQWRWKRTESNRWTTGNVSHCEATNGRFEWWGRRWWIQ